MTLRLTAVLLALAAVPLTAGTLRLLQLSGGPAVLPADGRFGGFPVALVVHIAGAAILALGGLLQLKRRSAGHRCTGRIVVAAGLLVALSALWLTLFYAPQPGTGELLYGFRLIFGSALAACLVLGFAAIRRRDVAAHRAWMIRAYAIGLGAGTQVFTEAAFGDGDLPKGAAWLINLAVAEWAISRS